MIFREEHIKKILSGEKTMTRRRHKHPRKVGKVYRIQRGRYDWTDIKIIITRAFQQRLSDITPEDALKEGGYTIEEFRKVWEKINRSWDPDEVVWVYEFQIYSPKNSHHLNDFLGTQKGDP